MFARKPQNALDYGIDNLAKCFDGLENSEVEKIFHIPLNPLLETMMDDSDPNHNPIDGMCAFDYQGQIVWGASARILQQIKNILKS